MANEIDVHVGKRLREARLAKGLSQVGGNVRIARQGSAGFPQQRLCLLAARQAQKNLAKGVGDNRVVGHQGPGSFGRPQRRRDEARALVREALGRGGAFPDRALAEALRDQLRK